MATPETRLPYPQRGQTEAIRTFARAVDAAIRQAKLAGVHLGLAPGADAPVFVAYRPFADLARAKRVLRGRFAGLDADGAFRPSADYGPLTAQPLVVPLDP